MTASRSLFCSTYLFAVSNDRCFRASEFALHPTDIATTRSVAATIQCLRIEMVTPAGFVAEQNASVRSPSEQAPVRAESKRSRPFSFSRLRRTAHALRIGKFSDEMTFISSFPTRGRNPSVQAWITQETG